MGELPFVHFPKLPQKKEIQIVPKNDNRTFVINNFQNYESI